MQDGDILILKGHEVDELLAGRELELMQTVRKAYETHHPQLPEFTAAAIKTFAERELT